MEEKAQERLDEDFVQKVKNSSATKPMTLDEFKKWLASLR